MPGMSGFELLSIVRRRFPGIQVIAMSGAFSGDNIQVGVAADAFYEKATGLANLMNIVQALANPDTQTIPYPVQPRASSPLWIQRNAIDLSESPCITISCPDCLRTFPQVAGSAVGNVHIHETECLYCASPIQYAIVESTNPASPHGIQGKPALTIPPPLQPPARD